MTEVEPLNWTVELPITLVWLKNAVSAAPAAVADEPPDE
jgi:hypothetical protein